MTPRAFLTSCCITVALAASLSCDRERIDYQEQFNLDRFRTQHYDLYNPITNAFSSDPRARREHPDYYQYDVYVDADGVVQYAFWRSGSYGYVMEFIFDAHGRLDQTAFHPVLAGTLDSNAEVVVNRSYYSDGELRLVKDQLNGELILLRDGSPVVIRGVLTDGPPFAIREVNREEYTPSLLH